MNTNHPPTGTGVNQYMSRSGLPSSSGGTFGLSSFRPGINVAVPAPRRGGISRTMDRRSTLNRRNTSYLTNRNRNPFSMGYGQDFGRSRGREATSLRQYPQNGTDPFTIANIQGLNPYSTFFANLRSTNPLVYNSPVHHNFRSNPAQEFVHSFSTISEELNLVNDRRTGSHSEIKELFKELLDHLSLDKGRYLVDIFTQSGLQVDSIFSSIDLTNNVLSLPGVAKGVPYVPSPVSHYLLDPAQNTGDSVDFSQDGGDSDNNDNNRQFQQEQWGTGADDELERAIQLSLSMAYEAQSPTVTSDTVAPLSEEQQLLNAALMASLSETTQNVDNTTPSDVSADAPSDAPSIENVSTEQLTVLDSIANSTLAGTSSSVTESQLPTNLVSPDLSEQQAQLSSAVTEELTEVSTSSHISPSTESVSSLLPTSSEDSLPTLEIETESLAHLLPPQSTTGDNMPNQNTSDILPLPNSSTERLTTSSSPPNGLFDNTSSYQTQSHNNVSVASLLASKTEISKKTSKVEVDPEPEISKSVQELLHLIKKSDLSVIPLLVSWWLKKNDFIDEIPFYIDNLPVLNSAAAHSYTPSSFNCMSEYGIVNDILLEYELFQFPPFVRDSFLGVNDTLKHGHSGRRCVQFLQSVQQYIPQTMPDLPDSHLTDQFPENVYWNSSRFYSFILTNSSFSSFSSSGFHFQNQLLNTLAHLQENTANDGENIDYLGSNSKSRHPFFEWGMGSDMHRLPWWWWGFDRASLVALQNFLVDEKPLALYLDSEKSNIPSSFSKDPINNSSSNPLPKGLGADSKKFLTSVSVLENQIFKILHQVLYCNSFTESGKVALAWDTVASQLLLSTNSLAFAQTTVHILFSVIHDPFLIQTRFVSSTTSDKNQNLDEPIISKIFLSQLGVSAMSTISTLRSKCVDLLLWLGISDIRFAISLLIRMEDILSLFSILESDSMVISTPISWQYSVFNLWTFSLSLLGFYNDLVHRFSLSIATTVLRMEQVEKVTPQLIPYFLEREKEYSKVYTLLRRWENLFLPKLQKSSFENLFHTLTVSFDPSFSKISAEPITTMLYYYSRNPDTHDLITDILKSQLNSIAAILIKRLSMPQGQPLLQANHFLKLVRLAIFFTTPASQPRFPKHSSVASLPEKEATISTTSSSDTIISPKNKWEAFSDTLHLKPLWDALDSRLSKASKIKLQASEINDFLPLIESYFTQYQSPKELIEFCTHHRVFLNDLIRESPQLLTSSLSFMLQHSKLLLDFDNKRRYFRREVARLRTGNRLALHVRRGACFEDSFNQLKNQSTEDLRGKLSVKFIGERGIDMGGVKREYFSIISRRIFHPGYALFKNSSTDQGDTFQPNHNSAINPEHLDYFRVVGIIIGKALLDSELMSCFFTRSFYKHILGIEPSFEDLEGSDITVYRTMKWLHDTDISDTWQDLGITFSRTISFFGNIQEVDLVENGRNIDVTQENKHKYLTLLTNELLTKAIQPQIDSFCEGLCKVIPSDLLAIFSPEELELLISGMPTIDVENWMTHSLYTGYSPDDPIIHWFWEIVFEMTQEELSKLLMFCTGTSRVSSQGFAGLQGYDGIQYFQIHRTNTSPDTLPSAHTCMNQLDISCQYPSRDHMKEKLLKAITYGSDYFGFA